MKLAEALILRKDLQQRLAVLERRLIDAARVQEGEAPPEAPESILQELNQLMAALQDLIVRINLTNSTPLEDGQTLTAMLARRDVLTQKVGILRNLASTASDLVSRARYSEIRILSTVDVAAIRKQADALSKEVRELDMAIQALNWTVELK